MKLFIHFFSVIFLLEHGVSGVDTESVSVNEGDSVTLNTGVQTSQQEDIRWYYYDTRIALIRGDLSKICTDVQCNEGTERFRDRLKLENQTGSLTIMNITNTHSGDYQLQINATSNDVKKTFIVTVLGVSAAERAEVKEGESVTLDPGETKHPNHEMMWYFNDKVIAEITEDQNKICTDDRCKERFRDRLKLDQTGSLTIMNTRNTDSGEYKLKINSKSSSFSISREKRFSVSVTAVPDSGQSSAAVAGIVVVVLLVAAVVTVAVIYRRRRRPAPGL